MNFRTSISILFLGLTITGCGGGSSSNDGPPPANTTAFNVTLSGTQALGDAAGGTASGTITFNRDDNSVTATVTLNGVTATGVSLRAGYAGENGEELLALAEDTASQWSLPADTSLDAGDLVDLDAGRLYLEVATANGTLRGQLIPDDLALIIAALTGDQQVPPVATAAAATAGLTYDPATGELALHVTTADIDAQTAHVFGGFAGSNGEIIINLTQDNADPTHWSAEADLSGAGLAELEDGGLYVGVTSIANPDGEIRGQLVPSNVEVVLTDLTGSAVVPPVVTANSGSAATTVQSSSETFTVHVNLTGLDNATSVALHHAPDGENGPQAITLTRDPNDVAHWSVSADPSAAQFAALGSQSLYVLVSSPANPAGELRGQLEPADSSPPTAGTFTVVSVDPANAAAENTLPESVTITFNRNVLAASAGLSQVTVLASGGDGSFADGNELTITPTGVSTSGTTLTIDLSGVVSQDDTYRVTLDGTSDDPIADVEGQVLDGDDNGTPGGDFSSAFTVVTPVDPVATFTEIQNGIFTPECAGCHGGGSPAAGLDLSAGSAYNELVNVPSAQNGAMDLVEPNDPDNSYLVRKLEADGVTLMPPGGALSAAEIQDVRDWIADGAPNN